MLYLYYVLVHIVFISNHLFQCSYYRCWLLLYCVGYPRWVLDHLLSYVWEIPLGGINLIPPRHLRILLLLFNFLSSHLLSSNPHPPLISCHPISFLAHPPSPFILLHLYVCVCARARMCLCLDTKKRKKEKGFATTSLKWFLNLH